MGPIVSRASGKDTGKTPERHPQGSAPGIGCDSRHHTGYYSNCRRREVQMKSRRCTLCWIRSTFSDRRRYARAARSGHLSGQEQKVSSFPMAIRPFSNRISGSSRPTQGFPPPVETWDKGHSSLEHRRIRISTALNKFANFPHVLPRCNLTLPKTCWISLQGLTIAITCSNFSL